MKKNILILLLLVSQASLYAAHIAGGELQYTYLGQGSTANSDRYQVTMRLFRECSSNGPQLAPEIVNVGAYAGSTNILQASVILPLVSGVDVIRLQENIPCLVGSPDVCYQVAIYSAQIELPKRADGYTLAWSRCCRANGMISASGSQLGATYIARIYGTSVLGTEVNSSPQFVVKDTALVCGGNDFILDFGANDPNGDTLTYAFCDAYNGGTTGAQAGPPPSTLVLTPIPYNAPYSGIQPLGPAVTIDPTTGIISGIAPATPGRYVVNVCVTEWRHGVAIGEHRKDFILKVGDCNIISAKLLPQYVNCNSYTSAFQNEANSTQVNSYFWDFGVGSSTSDTANVAQPSFTFPDTGTYKIMLIINRDQECSDTATSFAKIYPGFKPGFTFTGSCYQNPFQFTDTTKAAYGQVNSWKWDFGEISTTADTSVLKNPSYQYAAVGSRSVKLFVGSSKGCTATVQTTVVASDKPLLELPFHDTLICSIDSLMLFANGTGSFTWTPNSTIINRNTSTPVVFPQDSTRYYVDLDDKGCKARDSIQVNVLKTLTVSLDGDTAICETDSIRLNVVSHALSYSWSPVEGLNSSTIKMPMASPGNTTQYIVSANLGKCQEEDSIVIRVSPYPGVNAGNDTSICFGDKVQLHGMAVGKSFMWTPSNGMLNANTLSPFAATTRTTGYILTVTGYNECPKSLQDTVTITVIQQVKAFAGRDTVVTADEPLMLHASGGENYLWSPPLYMEDPAIATPVIMLSNTIDSITYRVKVTTAEGCTGQDDIKIVVFKTGPQIFVPDAFTPNHDGKNDWLYPVLAGMKQLDYFRVYNRYGQLVFATSEIGKSWDGSFGGKEQPTGTFVYMAQAVNYKGETVFRKGTVLLIR
jgi:gliding motility-associated-like protein